MTDDSPEISVVIPAYNEGAKILTDLQRACAYLSGAGYRYEVVVVDDGSTDDTSDKVRKFQRDGQPVKLLGYAGNRGKGFAVKTGMLQAAGRHLLFADAGGCVPYAELEKGRRRLDEGWDVAIGSRGLGESRVRVKQPWYRQLGSRAFGFLVHHAMGLGEFADTQCGFKIFRREVAHALFGASRIDGFMFDIEMLVNARRMGYRVCEFPVEWTADPDSRFRIVAGSARNTRELFRIFFGRAR